MNAQELRNLKRLLAAFCAEPVPSVAQANEIEAALVEAFYDYDEFQDLLDGLAAYRPGGSGLGLYDEHRIKPTATAALEAVDHMLTD